MIQIIFIHLLIMISVKPFFLIDWPVEFEVSITENYKEFDLMFTFMH